jgi:small subunit ribosomal protein S15
MARMHSRKKGQSGSTRPVRKTAPSWLKYKPFEVEKLVVKLAKEGYSSAMIGLILRDSYGIPSVKAVTGKKVEKILKENNLTPKVPEDLKNLMKRVLAILKHMEKNKKDMTAKRGLQLTESKIRRLVKYYKKVGKLPSDWKYSRDNINLLLK